MSTTAWRRILLGVTRHAFFNDTGPRYNAGASADAWRRLLDWFGRYLAAQ